MGPDTAAADSFVLEPKVEWASSHTDSLQMDVEVIFDSVPVPPGFKWIPANQKKDPEARVKFLAPGEYKIRLKITGPDLLNPVVEYKQLEIVPRIRRPSVDSFPEIIGPQEGLVGEYLVFSCKGQDVNFWYWKFGDGKHHDREELEQVVYAYDKEGVYTVRLKTNLSEQWVYHRVHIKPTWNVDSIPEFVDSAALIQDWLRIHLQRIADTEVDDPDNYYKEKKLIERTYLSARLKPIPVYVNDAEIPTDFDSYCQRIHMLEGELQIQSVYFQWDGDSTYQRIKELMVTQKRKHELEALGEEMSAPN